MTVKLTGIKIKTHRLPDSFEQSELVVFMSSGIHSGFATADTAAHAAELAPEVATYEAVIQSIPESANIVVLYEHPDTEDFLLQLNEQAQKHRQIIIAPIGHRNVGAKIANSIALFFPEDPAGSQRIILDKMSHSFDDVKRVNGRKCELIQGTELHLLQAGGLKLGVLNCHEYTHADVVKALCLAEIEVLIVSTRNQASKLFTEYAESDIHRLSCFVIINNVADYGGSGIYAPFSRAGGKKGQISLGGSLFSTRGPSHYTSTVVPLPLSQLRECRGQSQKPEPLPPDAIRYDKIDFPEQFKLFPNAPHFRPVVSDSKNIVTCDLDKIGYRRTNQGLVKVAVGQLRSLTLEDYVKHSYCLSKSPRFQEYSDYLLRHLNMLIHGSDPNLPDIVVLPEVFVPLAIEPKIKSFVTEHNIIVIAGVDYDEQRRPELYGTKAAYGINRCRVYVPITQNGRRLTCGQYEYQKLTRSQYDAKYILDSTNNITKSNLGDFAMPQGNELLRFSASGLGSFGVLICYDLSHFEIVHAINLGASTEVGKTLDPLETLFVVSHNPNAELYRRCCLADCHRFYQYIVMSNVSQYGGSGVFGPIRTAGERRTLLSAGKNVEGIFSAEIDIERLRIARTTSQENLNSSASDEFHARLIGEPNPTFQKRPGCLHERFVFTKEP